VYLGSQQGNSSFPGSISNFKLYDVALTAEEVAMEYALGRTGKSVNLTDTSLCLGGTVPRAQLDVRGTGMFDGGLVIKYKNSLEYARDGGIMMSRAGLGNVTNKYSSQPIILDGGDSGAIDGNLRGGAIWSQWGGSQYGIAMRGASLGDTYPYLQDPALFVTKDKVGIGTTSPVGKFDVWDGASNGSNIQQNAFFYLRNPANAATNYGAALVFENTDGAAGNRQGLGRIAALRENNAASYSSYLQFSPTLNGSEFEGMRITSAGKVGIGTNSFDTYDAFKVYNNLHSDGDGKTTFRVMHAGQIRTDRIGLGGEAYIMTDFGSAYPKIIYNRYGAAWRVGMSSASGGSSASSDFKFVYGSTIKAFFDANGSNNVDQNFTGQHRTFIKDVPFTEAGDLEGLIVSADQNKYIKMSGGIEAGSNAITTNESLPIVSRSTVASDKKCFGVVSSSEDPDTRKNRIGNFVSVSEKELGDTRVYINSVGEGAMWVTDINGPLESGDYITTSNVAGYGMKQDDDVLHNYTVAKITMDCDFSPATQPVQQIVKELGNVNYWVETTYSDVTLEEYSKFTEENRRTVTTTRYSNEEGDISPSEYSNLESNVQATYSEIETVTYQKIERKESTTEQEGYTLEVREELVNVLDEHGQLQWEDHPTDTEKAYKIRYLDADGKITTEANKVYTAAFVGCTYHCG
jgi:hypothetical protein